MGTGARAKLRYQTGISSDTVDPMAMTLRFPDDLDHRMKDQAQIEHVSVQALVNKAAREYLDRHELNREIDDGMAEIKAVYGDALRRLGE